MKILHWRPAYNLQIDAEVGLQGERDAVSAYRAGHDRMSKVGHGCVLHVMRNAILHEAIVGGFDVLFMQDADTYSPMDGGPVLPMIESMEAHDAAACFAIVTLRNMQARANVYPVKVGCVYEIEKGGTGMVAIDLRKIRPWYEAYDGPMFAPICTDRKQRAIEMGMDVYFSHRLRLGSTGVKVGSPGFKPELTIIADGRIPTVHVNGTAKLEYDGRTVPGTALAQATLGTSHDTATRITLAGGATSAEHYG